MQVQTFTGQLYDLRVPDLTTVSLDDIAHALGQICRFTGATRSFYSVAQHSVVCSFLAPPEYALDALLHDAPEAFVGDRSSPVACVYKWARNYGTDHPWSDPHQQMHDRAMIAIYYALSLDIPEAVAMRAVKEADYTALRHEATVHLKGGPAIEPETGEPWCDPLAIEPTTLIHPWASGQFEKDSGGLAASLLYGSIPPAPATRLFLTRLLELAQGPYGNPELEKLALASYHRPPLEPLSYRKIRQAFGGHDGRDPDDYPGAIH